MFDVILASFIMYTYALKQYHPDMNKSPGAEEKFKEISAAYEVFLFLFHHPVVCFCCYPLYISSLILSCLLNMIVFIWFVCFMQHTA